MKIASLLQDRLKTVNWRHLCMIGIGAISLSFAIQCLDQLNHNYSKKSLGVPVVETYGLELESTYVPSLDNRDTQGSF